MRFHPKHAPVKLALASIGIGALGAMGLITATVEGAGAETIPAGGIEAFRPTADYGDTSTQSTAPPTPEVAVATPPVTAEPAPTEEPG
jgi:hypothetical protein